MTIGCSRVNWGPAVNIRLVDVRPVTDEEPGQQQVVVQDGLQWRDAGAVL